MVKHVRSVVVLSAALATASAVIGARASRPSPNELTVHEWGTFTSVAGADGQSMTWRPLSGPQDLPCFVTELNPGSFKYISAPGGLASVVSGPNAIRGISAKVRMETPVLYFYAPEDLTVSVNVRFPKGVITEWYPQATVAPLLLQDVANMQGGIEWKSVTVSSSFSSPFRDDGTKSHYYAARDTDATPVHVAGQHEKFLFYRGLASFPTQVAATLSGNNVSVTSSGLRSLILFANHQGRVGYQIERNPSSAARLRMPALTADVNALRADLETMLVGEGLFPREAKAMVETWRDSWFEEGTRLFYLQPQSAVDAILPLTVTPVPAHVARVFVGRVELITPVMEEDVEYAILKNDLDALNQYGRFLEPIAQRIAGRPAIASDPGKIQRVLASVAATHTPKPQMCQ